ncbi:hypothetical protein ACTXT7_013407 [Hymenolepis weldensis]
MDALKQKILDARESIAKLEADLAEKDKELLDIKQKHKTFEADVRAAHKNRDTLELKVEAAQKELKDCLLKLEESQKTAEESKKYECLFCEFTGRCRAADSLEKKRNTQEKLISELEDKLQKVTETAKEAQTRSTQAIHELREIEEKIDQIEMINEKKEKTIAELQELNVLYSNKLKLMKSLVDNESAGVDEAEKEIKEANRRAKNAEDQAQINQIELARLEVKLPKPTEVVGDTTWIEERYAGV